MGVIILLNKLVGLDLGNEIGNPAPNSPTNTFHKFGLYN